MNTDKNLRLPTHPAAPVSALAAVPTIKEYPEQELTGAILQAAFAVHNTLGAGFLERVYSSALAIELDGKGPKLVPNDQLQVKYRGSVAGDSIADMIVGDRVILEQKAWASLDPQRPIDELSSRHPYLRGAAAEFRPPEVRISNVRLLK
jgi:GxxExxY protein